MGGGSQLLLIFILPPEIALWKENILSCILVSVSTPRAEEGWKAAGQLTAGPLSSKLGTQKGDGENSSAEAALGSLKLKCQLIHQSNPKCYTNVTVTRYKGSPPKPC